MDEQDATKDCLFLVDTSASMDQRVGPRRERKIDLVRAGLKQFCMSRWADNYYDIPLRIGITLFRQTGLPEKAYFEQVIPLYPTPSHIEIFRIDGIRVRGGSPLHEAFRYAALVMGESTRPVKVVKLIGDGGNDGPDPSQAIEEVSAAGVKVDSLEVSEKASELMLRIAQRTSGSHYLINSIEQMNAALES